MIEQFRNLEMESGKFVCDGETVMTTPNLPMIIPPRRAWNRGRIIGQKRLLQPKNVWAIRVRLEIADSIRDLALFNLAIDIKLRGEIWFG